MSQAMINHKILQWAVGRAAVDIIFLSSKFKVKPQKISSWLSGEAFPTVKQAQKLADILHVPVGYLFLDEIPNEELMIPDLRTFGSDPQPVLDPNFRDLIKDVLFKRDWYRDFIEDTISGPLPFVGKFKLSADASAISEDMRNILFSASQHSQNSKNSEEYLRNLITAAEGIGIWVMRNGIVGNNTHRPLSVKQLRGFAISDPFVPLVFINGRDAKAAQLFTLAHELAHIWLGQSGISNVDLGEEDFQSFKEVEKKCNAIAAEFLVPRNEFVESWISNKDFMENLGYCYRKFKVSKIVIARRAYDLNLINRIEYMNFHESEVREWNKLSEGDSGGDFYNNLPLRNGARFTEYVVREAVSGRLLFRQAAELLNTQPSTLVKFHQKRQKDDAILTG